MNRAMLGFWGAMLRQNRAKMKSQMAPAQFRSLYGDFQRRLTAMSPSNKGSLGVDAWGNDLSSSGSSGAKQTKSVRKKAVKEHSRVKDLPKSATKHAKGASLLTRRIPGATLT
jgi:hypothetical protein